MRPNPQTNRPCFYNSGLKKIELFFNVNFKKMNPKNPDTIEAIIITILELFISATSS